MATAGNLCTTIISDLNRGDLSISDIVLLDIQSAIRDYESYRFTFNEQILTVTVTATQTYALSLFAASGTGVAEVVEIDDLAITIPASRTYSIQEVTWMEMGDIDSGVGTLQGYPQIYAVYNQNLQIYPKPNALFLAVMSAHVKLTEIAAGGMATSNAWTNQASELIRCAALKRLWGRKYQNMQMAQAMQVAESQALSSLQRRNEAITSTRIRGYF